MPARAEYIPKEGETQVFHEVYDVVLYLGIIDILQEYNMSKKLEHAYKSIQFDSVSISAVDPTYYSERFLEFIRKVFPTYAVATWTVSLAVTIEIHRNLAVTMAETHSCCL